MKRYKPNQFEAMQRIANVLELFDPKIRHDMLVWITTYARRKKK